MTVPPSDSPAPVADPGPAPDLPPAGAAAEPPAPAPEPEADTFDRPYVEKLRDEAARYRVTAKEREEALGRYTSVFGDADDQTVDTWLGLTQTVLADPQGAGAKELIRLAKGLAGEQFDSFLQDEPRPLTEDEVQAKIEEGLKADKEAAEQEAAYAAVLAKADALGYADETPERALLFWLANKKADADLDKAHELFSEWRQGIIDSYVSEKRAKNDQFPPVSDVPAGAGPSPEDAPRDIRTASERARARFAAAAAAGA